MNITLLTGAVLGLTAVAAGAYAHHGIDPGDTMKVMSAVRLQQVHGVVIVAVGLAFYSNLPDGLKGMLKIVAGLFTLGIVLFSGNIYLNYFVGFKLLSFLVPYGGMVVMAGWLVLMWAAVRYRIKG